jgi:preprotein translocase subunit SecD
MDLSYATASELTEALAQRDVSSRELLDHVVARIDEVNEPLNAVVALAANLLILLAAMAYSGATLTLPGIAGVILTIGVGVDTNVLIFERIREELRNGKTVRVAIQNGFERVLITIIDTHATAIIAAAFLFTFGTGPIKGFAVTLVIGLIANVFASYFVSRFLFEWVLGKRHVESLSI